tara:strand:- start:3542 stop:4402 length:861 start_codon:yes stop_codon:yes gene_type:complete
MAALPTVFINHGGGPCFFMPDDGTGMFPKDTWRKMGDHLKQLGTLPGKHAPAVKSILVVSAHWETPRAPFVTTSATPPLLYDYYGFPGETYSIKWPAPGNPDLARRVIELLDGSKEFANEKIKEDNARGFDHGVFVPLKLAFPDAEIPVVQLSLVEGLDSATHLKIGKLLKPLRDENVLIVGSGMSFHDMGSFFYNNENAKEKAKRFDDWLNDTCGLNGDVSCRDEKLKRWHDAPCATFCHPREEHLMPLMVVAGAASGEKGQNVYQDQLNGLAVSGYAFGVQDAG